MSMRKVERKEIGLAVVGSGTIGRIRAVMARDYLNQLAEKLGYTWAQVEKVVLTGPVPTQLVDYAKKNAIDLIVKKAVAEGKTEPIWHARTRPMETEAEATNRAIQLSRVA